MRQPGLCLLTSRSRCRPCAIPLKASGANGSYAGTASPSKVATPLDRGKPTMHVQTSIDALVGRVCGSWRLGWVWMSASPF